MGTPLQKLAIRAVGAVLLGVAASWPAFAHRVVDPLDVAPAAPAAGAREEVLSGVLHRVTIDDRVAGMVVYVHSLVKDDGTAVALKGANVNALADGARVELAGRRNGRTLFVSAARTQAPPPDATRVKPKGAALQERRGRLALLHVDRFAEGQSEFIFELHEAGAEPTALAFPVLPEPLQPGMAVVVRGRIAADGTSLDPEAVTILALPETPVVAQDVLAAAAKTNNVLVILMTFTNSPATPFTQAQVQSVFAGATGSVAQYFSEVSFGQQLVNATVTGWLPTNAATPSGCNFQQMGTLGRSAATAAGYNLTSYQNLVYVFPAVSSCGWAGLAYIGASGVWINGRNTMSVYAHELGHNFGLLHAGSLRCSGVPIGGTCTVSEYGDPFDVMGNQSAMHFNAAQKLDLGWIAAGTVVTHGTGVGTYVLNPIETTGGSVYAVRIPAAANRTYWLEYRQPIGFDAALASYPNNGAQVRVAAPFETLCSGCDSYSNDTQLLDMTPGTSSFTDAALVVGKSFADATYGINVSVLAASAGALTVQVSTPGGGPASTTTVLASSANPAPAGIGVTFTATVTGIAPAGSVGFTADGATITGCAGVALVTSGNTGIASCTTGGLAPGTHGIVARYGGNAGNAASTSSTLSQVVNAPPRTTTTTTLATSVNPGLTGANVTFTATVTGSAPTGSVGFADGGSAIGGCAAVPLVGSGNARTASCTTSALAAGSHGVAASYAGDAANAGSTSATLVQAVLAPPPGIVWVDDSLPVGAITGGTESWSWISANPVPFSGGLAHQSALQAGVHQHFFYGVAGLPVGLNDTLYVYVYLDPANPPSEVMVQWYDGISWKHKAYWGANAIPWGTDGTASRRYMGPLPATGQWVRLEIPAAAVGLDGLSVSGMTFTLYDGRATWDRAGILAGIPADVALIDDALPAGAATGGTESWNWTSANPTPFSGALAHASALQAGVHQHFFYGTTGVAVGPNDTLFAYVYLDPANPPSEVMLQWYDGISWKHKAYWGANAIPWGTDGTVSRRYVGPLPVAGQWARLEVPAAAVGLDGLSVGGMTFTLYDGRATWDRAGIRSWTP